MDAISRPSFRGMAMWQRQPKFDPPLREIKAIMRANGANRILLKWLAPNDNSKNQIYLGPGFESLNLLPNSGVTAEVGKPHFKASISMFWVEGPHNIVKASGAQLILYPQYPEVRLSGVLRDRNTQASTVIASRENGRVMLFGITEDRRVLAFAGDASSAVAKDARQIEEMRPIGVFLKLELDEFDAPTSAKAQLLRELARIHQAGWIAGKRLDRHGIMLPCNSGNCGGYTLEAELGVRPNGYAEPDYLGWEIKSHSVLTHKNPEAGVLTLMTPEPTDGLYKSVGVEEFVRRFGYVDTKGRTDRLNFGGVHKFGETCARTGLALTLLGYSAETERITDPFGGIALVTSAGDVAALWAFESLIEHWNRKHALAAYVPSLHTIGLARSYYFGHLVRLGEGTDFLRFLKALASKDVYYDPGIKLEQATSSKPQIKRRSQFRMHSRNLANLYRSMYQEDLREQSA